MDLHGFDEAETSVIGWGTTELGVTSPVLREAKALLVPVDKCKKARLENGSVKSQHQICTRHFDGMHAGQADSGGPLFQLAERDSIPRGYVQLGIVSSRARRTHVFYTDVSHFVGWI